MMPAGNGTGPKGMGRMTGRGAGYCAGNGVPGYMNLGFGRGIGRGGGRGLGFGFGLGFRGGRGRASHLPAPYPMQVPTYGDPSGVPYGAGPTAEQETDMLKAEAEYLAGELDGIRKRIEELEARESMDTE